MALRAACVPQVGPRHGLGCSATGGTTSTKIKVLQGSRCIYTSQTPNGRRYITINSQTTRAIKRHCSPFSRGSIRVKSYWHRPGCTWASSKGDINAAQRDEECPACQSAKDEPYEYTMREMLWQQKRNLVDMRRMLEKHPYETFFGMSNARLSGQDPMRFISEARRRMLDDLRLSCASRRSLVNSSMNDNSRSRDGASDSSPRKDSGVSNANKPKSPEEAASGSISGAEGPKGSPHIHASITWSSSNTDTDGVRHVSTGRLIYDPISGRMVPSDEKPSESGSLAAGAGLETSKASTHTGPSKDSAKHGQNQAEATESDKSGNWVGDTETTHVTESSSPRLATSLDRHSRAEAKTAPPPDKRPEKTDPRQRKWNSMIQSWKQEQESANQKARSKITEPSDSQPSADQSSLESRRKRAEAWLKYNNARHNEIPNTKKSRLGSSRASSAVNDPNSKAHASVSRDSSHSLQGTHSWQNIVRRDVSSLGAISVLRKDKPLKSMTHMELSRHRAALLKAWTPRSEATVPNAAERRLREEIAKHKNDMMEFEQTRNDGGGKFSNNQTRSGFNSLAGNYSQPSPTQSGTEVLAGEGDMSPNVAEFARMDRWYKKKAPHATQSEKSKSQDQELVSSIRSAYENAYGTINSAHRQPASVDETTNIEMGHHNRSINPVDGTAPAMPSPVPQTGNFASPTGFVNHDVITPSSRSSPSTATWKDDRIIRKVEPSFSGAIPVQKYNTKEIQEIWNKQGFSAPDSQSPPHGAAGLNGGSEPSRGGGIPHHHHQQRRGQSDKKRRRRSRLFLRGVVRVLAIGSWTAVCCYATGYIIEETRAGSFQSSFESHSTTQRDPSLNDSPSSSSLNFLSRRRHQRKAREAAAAEEEAARRAAAQKVGRGTWVDMPLHGLELPLMGALSACVWYLIWGGQ